VTIKTLLSHINQKHLHTGLFMKLNADLKKNWNIGLENYVKLSNFLLSSNFKSCFFYMVKSNFLNRLEYYLMRTVDIKEKFSKARNFHQFSRIS
jgi:hypothetical protein